MTLQEEWKIYRDLVYPKGISGTQNRETHQAFFAGAFVMTKAMEAASELPEQEGAVALGKLIAEAKEFIESIKLAMEARN